MSTAEIRIIPYNQIVDKSGLNPGRIMEVLKPRLVDDFF